MQAVKELSFGSDFDRNLEKTKMRTVSTGYERFCTPSDLFIM